VRTIGGSWGGGDGHKRTCRERPNSAAGSIKKGAARPLSFAYEKRRATAGESGFSTRKMILLILDK